jgi:hypothetical protein
LERLGHRDGDAVAAVDQHDRPRGQPTPDLGQPADLGGRDSRCKRIAVDDPGAPERTKWQDLGLGVF